MNAESRIRREARNHLSNNNWGKAIAITILLASIPVVLSYINHLLAGLFSLNAIDLSLLSRHLFDQKLVDEAVRNVTEPNAWIYSAALAVLLLVIFVASWPLQLGVTYWSYQVANGKSVTFGEIFRYYKAERLFIHAMRFYFHYMIRIFLWSLLFLLPGSILTGISSQLNLLYAAKGIPTMVGLFVPIGMVLSIVGAIALIPIAFRYFLAPYFAVMDDKSSEVQCIKISWQTMEGRRTDLLKLLITFIPWGLLCFFVIPVLYVAPYFYISMANCAKWLIYEKDKKEQKREAEYYTAASL